MKNTLNTTNTNHAFNACFSNTQFVECLNALNASKARYTLQYDYYNKQIIIELDICVRCLYDNTNTIVCVSDDSLSDFLHAYQQLSPSALSHYRIKNFLQYIEHCFAFHDSLRF